MGCLTRRYGPVETRSSFSPGSIPILHDRPILRQQIKVATVQAIQVIMDTAAAQAQVAFGCQNQPSTTPCPSPKAASHNPVRSATIQGYQTPRIAIPIHSRGRALGSLPIFRASFTSFTTTAPQ